MSDEEIAELLIEDIFHDGFGSVASLFNLLSKELTYPLSNSFVEFNRRKRRQREDAFAEEKILTFDDEEFKEHFRMKRSSFDVLLNLITNSMPMNEDTDLRRNLLYTLWLLSKPDSFSSAGNKFNLAKSSGHCIFKEVVHSLRCLLPDFVKWPDLDTYSDFANKFFDISNGIPGVVGVTGTCHITCKQPPNTELDYCNTSGSHSIILQGTCDPDGKFIDVFIGMPGCMGESEVFKESSLFKNLTKEHSPLLPPDYHIIGDQTYPLHENILVPFISDGNLTREKIRYNTKLAKLQGIVEKSFERFKGTFERLQFLITADMKLANEIIAACCVLHNFIIEREQGEFKPRIKEEVQPVNSDNSDEECFAKGRAAKKRRLIMTSLE